MELLRIASYLVPASKNSSVPPQIQGVLIPDTGNLHDMLLGVFLNSVQECQIPIRFLMSADGTQTNPARKCIIQFLKDPTLSCGQTIAERLSSVTTNKSGLGLLFLLVGCEGYSHRLVLSRFPAEQGVVAEATQDSLAVQFIERVFMKNAASYKAALYEGESFDGHFWTGSAIDRQINASEGHIAHYWIREFLASDFETTSKAGTKRFAIALRDASKSVTDISTKHQLVAFSMLVPSLAGQSLSIDQIMDRFSLSDEAKSAIVSHLQYPALAQDTFLLDREEFLGHATLASVELNTGAILLAPPDRFQSCFDREVVDAATDLCRFTAEGRIVDERVRGRK